MTLADDNLNVLQPPLSAY